MLELCCGNERHRGLHGCAGEGEAQEEAHESLEHLLDGEWTFTLSCGICIKDDSVVLLERDYGVAEGTCPHVIGFPSPYVFDVFDEARLAKIRNQTLH